MQVIETKNYRKYLCPMKDSTLDEKSCDGPKCMWWCYMVKEIFKDAKKFPYFTEYEIDLDRGHCGK